jgi:hypothetical protein
MSMRKAVLLTTLALAACVEHQGIRPLRPLEIATAPYQPVSTAALPGSLMYEGGCLIFRNDENGALMTPIVPSGSTFNGTALTFHVPGKADQLVAIHEEVLFYGEPQQWAAFQGPAYDAIQHQCGAFAPFLVTGARPAN